MSKDFDLNGRPAEQFTVTISERQFRVVRDRLDGASEVMAESSSGDTFKTCVDKMLEMGTGQKGNFSELADLLIEAKRALELLQKDLTERVPAFQKEIANLAIQIDCLAAKRACGGKGTF